MSRIHKPSEPINSPTLSAALTLFGAHDRTFEQRRAWGLMLERVRACLQDKHFEEGITTTLDCLRLAHSLFSNPGPAVLQCNILLGRLYFGSKQYDLANKAFQAALDLCETQHSDISTTATLFGYIAAAHVENGDLSGAIDAYKKRLLALNEASQPSNQPSEPIRQLTIDTLKELSALCLNSGDLAAAEGYAYKLAHLQDSGLERGKTLLLLAQIYRATGNAYFARDTAVQAQDELLSGAADHYEPLVLATAYRLEARLLFDRKLFELALEKYQLSRAILYQVYGHRHLDTALCGCDIAVVNMYLSNSPEWAVSLYNCLEQAISLSKQGCNTPELRPYIVASASFEHKLGLIMFAALAAVEGLVQRGDISLLSVSRKLQNPALIVAWESVFNQFPRGVDRQTLLPFLTESGERHFKNALTRYVQLVGSLQNDFGVKENLEVAAVYDQMSSAHYALGNSTWAERCKQKAAVIRSSHEKGDGGNQR